MDGKTKNDHFQAMFVNAVDQKQIKARTIVFDGWYASAQNVKRIHRRKRIFFTTLKSNRLGSLSKEAGYCHLEDVEWTADRLAQGVLGKLKEVPFPVRLFKLVTPDGDIDWVITNDLDETMTAQVAEASSDVRWQVEEFHKVLKTGLGVERLQLTTAPEGFAATAVMSIGAGRLVGLRERLRQTPTAPAAEAGLTEVELTVLRARSGKALLTVGEVALALGRLGGHLNHTGDGWPGWLTL